MPYLLSLLCYFIEREYADYLRRFRGPRQPYGLPSRSGAYEEVNGMQSNTTRKLEIKFLAYKYAGLR